ncbi:restriction endonuclease subunit S [Phascolarctobacterium faecium]|uniref:restriction endonuclease subunit S n=1 Tax=Phascolarctobacterium faecium TaxID=33025 RepID=UPI00210A0E2D|nr:restriction endonuclease subunit S [Phascolarctobacterium faecium]MCQ5183918.1 restriction endonuclease subunit S [Phascolarctobacterium faecium]
MSRSDYDDEGNYRYISMATIKNWNFDFDSANVVSAVYSEAKSVKSVKKNDIILARSGEGTIGKVALIQDENLKGIFADFTMRIRLKD